MTPRKQLPNVTLFGLDCVDIKRLIQASDICQLGFKFGSVRLLTSIPSNHQNIVHIESVTNIDAYSNFVVHKLNSYIDTDFVLLIQYDGFILNPSAWQAEYLKYDYIGAPW